MGAGLLGSSLFRQATKDSEVSDFPEGNKERESWILQCSFLRETEASRGEGMCQGYACPANERNPSVGTAGSESRRHHDGSGDAGGIGGAITGFQKRPAVGSWGSEGAGWPDPAKFVAVSPIRELAIHLVSSTVVRAWGSLPTSFTVRMRCWDDLSSLTASSCRMLRKLCPFTSRIWSPTCRDHHTTQSPGPLTGHGLTPGASEP